jgi:hypothetical protein
MVEIDKALEYIDLMNKKDLKDKFAIHLDGNKQIKHSVRPGMLYGPTNQKRKRWRGEL